MRAKILFVAENNTCREDARPVQQALAELAIAFSHSFTMREIGFKPEAGFGDLADAVSDADAVLLLGSIGFAEQAALALDAFAGHVQLNSNTGLAELSRLKTGAAPELELVWPLDDKPAALGKAAVFMCALAKKNGKRLRYIRSQGTGYWQDSLNQAAKYAAVPPPSGITLEDQLIEILEPGQPGCISLCPKEQAAVLTVLLSYLGGSELTQHVAYMSDKKPSFAALVTKEQRLPLFSVLYAAVDAVRGALKLEREAACLETAIDNVISSGWRTMEFGLTEKTISSDEVIRLIAEQIQLAGQLYERFG